MRKSPICFKGTQKEKHSHAAGNFNRQQPSQATTKPGNAPPTSMQRSIKNRQKQSFLGHILEEIAFCTPIKRRNQAKTNKTKQKQSKTVKKFQNMIDND